MDPSECGEESGVAWLERWSSQISQGLTGQSKQWICEVFILSTMEATGGL